MYSNESSDAEPSRKESRYTKEKKKHRNKTDYDLDKRTDNSKSKLSQNSDTEDEYYYKKSKIHKSRTKSKNESRHGQISKRHGSSDLSDNDEAQSKSKIVENPAVTLKSRRKRSPTPKKRQSNQDENLKKYTKSKWSDSSDAARTPSPGRKNSKKTGYKQNDIDSEKPTQKMNRRRYEGNERYRSGAKDLQSKSRNKQSVSSETSRSPSPKRSKRVDDSDSFKYQDKKTKNKKKDENENRQSPNKQISKKPIRESSDKEIDESKHRKKKYEYPEENKRIDKGKNRTSPKSRNKVNLDEESEDSNSGKYRGGKDKTSKKLKDVYKKVASRTKEKSSENEHHDSDHEEDTSRKSKTTRDRSRSPRDRSRNKTSNGRDEYDDSEYSQKPIKFENYWSGGLSVRKNSDNYWNKYPLQEENTSSDKHEVGPRYYGAPPKKHVKKKSGDVESETEKQNVEKNEKPQAVAVEKPIPVKKNVDLLTSKTGGAYIPPAKLRMMQESITDKSSAAYQRLAWEALKKSIQGLVNKINISNIVPIVKELQRENIVRGRGLLSRAIIQAQATSPTFTHVYAALVAAINTKFPNIGELLLKRLVVQFRRGFKRNDKTICITAATFIAHLVNHQVAHEILALEILTLLVESPTNDSVEVAIAFLKECGMKLSEVSKKGIAAIFDMLRNILHEGNLETRVQYMIEVMFQIRKDEFKAHPSIVDGLNLVFEEDQFMHLITLEEEIDTQDILNVFKFDPEYEANEAKYKTLVVEDSDKEGSDESGESDDEDDSDEESEDEETGEKKSVIIDRTETNLVALRRTIYLTIQSSLDFEECAHKLLRMQIKPGQEIEMCHMFLDCCAEQRTYEKFYGLLAQRFCQINRTYIAPFEETFRDSYATIHRIETDKLRNIAKLFAHLLFTDAISWEVLSTIKLNEDDTTSSSRIFIKILFLELSEYMGLAKLNQRVKDPSLQTALEGLFPRDNPKNTRFAINFFTSIGLGGLTDELREHLKTQPKPSIAVPQLVEALSSSSDSSSSSESSSDSSTDSSSSDSSSESEDSTPERKSKKRNKSKRETKIANKKNVKAKKVSTSKKKKPNR